MFDGLQKRLGSVFDRLRGRGALSEGDVDAALAEVRTALVDADVALPVVKDFVAKVREQAVGEQVIRSVTPGQQVVKIVHDTLVQTLGGARPADVRDPVPQRQLSGSVRLEPEQGPDQLGPP